jgi:hypothetical protein
MSSGRKCDARAIRGSGPGVPSGRGDESERATRRGRGVDVGRQDHDRLREVGALPVRPGETPLVEDLQEEIVYLGVGLLDLVEEHHAVRVGPERRDEEPLLLVADIAGRGADELGHRVRLGELGHVEPHEPLFVREEGARQAPGKLGLPHAGRAQEEEDAGGFHRGRKTGPRGEHSPRHRLDGVLLADDAAVQLVLEVEEAVRTLL